MVRELYTKINNWKFAGPSVVLAGMVKASGKPGVKITKLVNWIIAEGNIPAEWEFTIIINYYKGKGDSLEKENYRRLKLTD